MPDFNLTWSMLGFGTGYGRHLARRMNWAVFLHGQQNHCHSFRQLTSVLSELGYVKGLEFTLKVQTMARDLCPQPPPLAALAVQIARVKHPRMPRIQNASLKLAFLKTKPEIGNWRSLPNGRQYAQKTLSHSSSSGILLSIKRL